MNTTLREYWKTRFFGLSDPATRFEYVDVNLHSRILLKK